MKRLNCERLEARDLPAALPVLMVIANQDFYYQEYNDTRNSLLAADVPVVVAATTTAPSKAHAGSGQGTGTGVVTPNIALADVDPANYSAIVFVGGWGASMYQYAFNDPNGDGKTDNFYSNTAYNGDANLSDGIIAPQKVAVNDLIGEFLAHDKPVAGVCHGVTVLAWARVNGVSPISGKNVVVPHTDGTPGMMYNGTSYASGFAQGQYIQALDNGAKVSAVGGQIGNPTTSVDDVVVDGRIITAENQHSAAKFGQVIAQEVIANNLPPTPITGPGTITLDEGIPGTLATFASTDPEGGPLTWSLTGPDAAKFSISKTGVLTSTVEFDGQFTGGVRVACADVGGDNSVKDVVIIVNNVAPVVESITGPSTLIVGETGTFTLTGVSDVAADLYEMHFHFKLNGVPVGGYDQALPQTYHALTHNEAGTYTIYGRAYDKDGGISATKSFTYNVVAPPTTVLSFNVNDGAAQRSRVTSLTVTFSAQVNAATIGAIAITRDDGVAVLPTEELYGNYNFNTNGTTTLTLTFSTTANSAAVRNGSLTDGRWRLAIPSIGYNSPGFFRLYGDFDGNGSVDGPADFAAFGNDFGRTMESPFDVNQDGVVDGPTDFAFFGANFGRTI